MTESDYNTGCAVLSRLSEGGQPRRTLPWLRAQTFNSSSQRGEAKGAAACLSPALLERDVQLD